MTYRTWLGVTATLAFAAIAGVTTSQQQPPSPVAATQVALTPSRAEAAELARARQDPLTTRFHRQLEQNKDLAGLGVQVAAATVPVLGPPDVGLLQASTFHNGNGHYMLVIEAEGRIIEIFGATKALQSPVAGGTPQPASTVAPRRSARLAAAQVPNAGRAAAQAPAEPRNLTDVRAERTEYGVDVAFRRFGAVYNVTFICETQGAGCAEADAIAFADGLVLLNGGGA